MSDDYLHAALVVHCTSEGIDAFVFFVGSRNPGRAVGRMCGMFSGGRSERSYVELYGLLLDASLALKPGS